MFSTRDRKPDAELAPPPSNPQNLWRFLAFARPYRWLIVLLVLTGVTRFALQFVNPGEWGLLDGALKNADHLPLASAGPRLERRSIGSRGAGGRPHRALLFQFQEGMLTGRLGNRLVFDLRRRLYSHIQRLSAQLLRQPAGGEHRVADPQATSAWRSADQRRRRSRSPSTHGAFFTLLVLFKMEWRLTLVAFLVMPGYVATLRHLNPRIRAPAADSGKVLAESRAPSTNRWRAFRWCRRLPGARRGAPVRPRDASATSTG